MGTITFWIWSLEKRQFGFNHWNPLLKTEFFETDSFIELTTSAGHMQSYFKIDLGLIKWSNVLFLCVKARVFWWLSWNGAYLGKDTRIQGLCSVSYTANEYSIYHFCIMISDFHFFFFSRVIVVQDFETVIFYVLFVYKPTSVIFCWMKRLHVSSQFNSLFILCMSTAKPFSLLVRGYIEVKISKHETW